MPKKKPTALDRKEMKKLLGAAPVLSSESHKDYDTILMRLMDCIDPDDVIELFYVKDLVDQIWEVNRLRLHKVLVMECAHQRHQEQEEERRQQSRRRNTAIAEDVKELFKAEQAGPAGEPTHVRLDMGNPRRRILGSVAVRILTELDQKYRIATWAHLPPECR